MFLGKHSEIGQQIATLQEELKRKEKELYEIKQKCANAFKEIHELSKGNSFDNDRAIKNKMGEIAKDNFNLLLDDLIDEVGLTIKKIELPTSKVK